MKAAKKRPVQAEVVSTVASPVVAAKSEVVNTSVPSAAKTEVCKLACKKLDFSKPKTSKKNK